MAELVRILREIYPDIGILSRPMIISMGESGISHKPRKDMGID